MNGSIHPTAIIEEGAKISNKAVIGPYCIIGAKVVIEDGVKLHSHVNVQGRTTLGENTQVFPFASLGTAPQDLKYDGEDTELVIGRNNTIREHVTMNIGTEGGGGKTVVGDHCLFMMACHVAHDCQVGNRVIMANNATLAGHVEVGDFVIVGGLAAVHQFVRIGQGAIIGGMSGVESDVIPYGRVKGERAHLAGLNLIGLERSGLEKDAIRALQRAFKDMFETGGTMDERINKVAQNYQDNSHVMAIIEFAKAKTQFPLCQPQKKTA